MAITDKTRKLLWGRSGNRCTICKRELVIEGTPFDDPSIVGEECHIVSSRANGPRYDPSFPKEKIDSYENLVLLCRTHHKMIDDQCETFTADILRQMKANHEKWVSERLNNEETPKKVRIRRVKENIPAFLIRLTEGSQVINIVAGACAFLYDHDELYSDDEVELIGDFLQMVQDFMDIWDELEVSNKIRMRYELTRELEKLEEKGFFVFGAVEHQILEDGIGPATDWPVAVFRIVRKENETIIRLGSQTQD